MVMRRVFDPKTRKWTLVETVPPVPTGTTTPSATPTTMPRTTTTTAAPRTTTTAVPRTTTTTVPRSTTTTTVPATPKPTGSAATNAAEAGAAAAGAAAASGIYGDNTPTASTGAGTTQDGDWLAGLKALNTPSGPSDAQRRAAGLAAAGELERFGRRAQNLYGTQAEDLASALQASYSPLFAEQRQDVEAQRQAQLKFLAEQYGANEQSINAATQAALAAIPQQSTVYSQVPLVELRGGENPLMGALATFGASREPVDVRAGADAQLAAQLAQMQRGAAGQLNTAQQAMLDAARLDATSGQSRALQALGLNRQAGELGIGADTRRALQGILGDEASAAANIEQARASLLSKGIEALLGGLESGAKTRAETIQKYGPPKAKPKPKSAGKGKGKGKGK